MSRATGTVPEWVQSRVHTTKPTGPVPEPFHCDHIARWSARSGTTGRSGTGVNTGARLRSGTVPVPKLWCEHGLTGHFDHLRNKGIAACAKVAARMPLSRMSPAILARLFLAVGSFHVKSPRVPHDPSQMFPKKLLKIPQCVLRT